MRGVAALVVALYHFQYTLPWRVRDYCFQSGYLAVDLFFVLSGFVIALSYDRKLAAGMTIGQFFKIRAIRLLPMIWIGVAIGGIYQLLVGRFTIPELATLIACNAFLLPYLGNGRVALFSADSSAWSLFFEWVANLVYALIWRWLTQAVLIAIIVVSACGLVVAARAYGELNLGHSFPNASVGVARVGFSFFLGILLWRTRSRWASLLPQLPSPLILVGVAICLFPQLTGVPRAFYDVAFVLILSPLLVMLGSMTEPTGRGVEVGTKLAALSYPLYAIHRPVQQLTEYFAVSAGISNRIAAFVALICVVPLSLWLASSYDEPIRSWLRRVTRRRAAEAAAP